MGYAQLEQTGHGIHLRQFSRAFVMEDGSGDKAERLVFVSVDAAMMGHGVRKEVRIADDLVIMDGHDVVMVEEVADIIYLVGDRIKEGQGKK